MNSVCAVRMMKERAKPIRYVNYEDLSHEAWTQTEERVRRLTREGFTPWPAGTKIKHGLAHICKHCGCHYSEDQ